MWSVPPIWRGQTVAILASGPSMSAEVAEQLRGVTCIAINNTFRLAPWAAMLYAADRAWWLHRDNADAKHFRGLRCTISREQDGPPPAGVLSLLSSGVIGFDPDPGRIRTGGNSAYQAAHVAAHAGAARILLAGCDLQGGHWHPEHPAELMQTNDIAFSRWLERWPGIAESGAEIINVTPGSALKCFPMMTIEAALARALAAA